MVGSPDVQTEKKKNKKQLNNMVIWRKEPTRGSSWPNVFM